jgi:hypothetical protein
MHTHACSQHVRRKDNSTGVEIGGRGYTARKGKKAAERGLQQDLHSCTVVHLVSVSGGMRRMWFAGSSAMQAHLLVGESDPEEGVHVWTCCVSVCGRQRLGAMRVGRGSRLMSMNL